MVDYEVSHKAEPEGSEIYMVRVRGIDIVMADTSDGWVMKRWCADGSDFNRTDPPPVDRSRAVDAAERRKRKREERRTSNESRRRHGDAR